MRRYRNVKCKKFPGGGYTIEEYEALQGQSIENVRLQFLYFQKEQYVEKNKFTFLTASDLAEFFDEDRKTAKQDFTLKFYADGYKDTSTSSMTGFTATFLKNEDTNPNTLEVYCNRWNSDNSKQIHTIELQAGDTLEGFIIESARVSYIYKLALAYVIIPK